MPPYNRRVARPAAGGAGAPAVSWSAGPPTVRATGEGPLLDRLVRMAGGEDAVLAIAAGDDAAGWRAPPGEVVLVTTDALVEDVDFRRRTQLPYEVGWKAYAVTASDLAAMGARPALVVVTLLLPADTATACVVALQEGIVDAAGEDGARVAGGDLSGTAGPLAVSCTLLGAAPADRCLTRSAGRPDDRILLTGELGAAAAALERLEAGDPPGRVPGAERWLRPRARVAAGRALAAAGVQCAIDCSDGMLLDTARLAAASGCGAELWADRMPLAPGLDDLWGDQRLARALTGGEDFELIVAAPAAVAERLLAGSGWGAGLPPLAVVGRLCPEPGLTLRSGPGGPALPIGSTHGFAHF